MLEYTHVKVDGPCELVVHGSRVMYATRSERAATWSEGSNVDAAGTSVVGIVIAGLCVLLQLVWGLCSAVLLWIVLPCLRELVCGLGAAAMFLGGHVLRVVAACMLTVSTDLHSRSNVLRACTRLLSCLPDREAEQESVARTHALERGRVIDVDSGQRPPMPRTRRPAPVED